MAIDWTKPVETVDGLPVNVIGVHDETATVTMLPDEVLGRNGHGPWSYRLDGTVGNHFLPDLRNVDDRKDEKAVDFSKATRLKDGSKVRFVQESNYGSLVFDVLDGPGLEAEGVSYDRCFDAETGLHRYNKVADLDPASIPADVDDAPTINFNEPLFYQGKPARLLGEFKHRRAGTLLAVAFEAGGHDEIAYFTPEGRCWMFEDDDNLALTNGGKREERWFNIYEDEIGASCHRDRDAAKFAAAPGAIAQLCLVNEGDTVVERRIVAKDGTVIYG